MMFLHGETVVLIGRTVTGRDSDGNDVYTDTETTLTNCPAWPRTSSELVQGQDLVIIGLNVLCPPGTNARAVDRARIDAGPNAGTYEVDGEPGAWSSPLTGWTPGVQVALTRVTG